MGRYPQTEDPEGFDKLLQWIVGNPVPNEKINEDWLKDHGFSSSRKRGYPSVLRFAGLIDKNGMPTDFWINYTPGQGIPGLPEKVESGYRELLHVARSSGRSRPDYAQTFFRREFPGKKPVYVQSCVKAFNLLCKLAGIVIAPAVSGDPGVSTASRPVPDFQYSADCFGGHSAQHSTGLRDAHQPGWPGNVCLNLTLTVDNETSESKVRSILRAFREELFEYGKPNVAASERSQYPNYAVSVVPGDGGSGVVQDICPPAAVGESNTCPQ